jgi:hypothetical protein
MVLQMKRLKGPFDLKQRQSSENLPGYSERE